MILNMASVRYLEFANVMIHTRRLLNMFGRFLFTEESNLP